VLHGSSALRAAVLDLLHATPDFFGFGWRESVFGSSGKEVFDIPRTVEHADNFNALAAGHVKNEICPETCHRDAAHTFEARHAGIVQGSGEGLAGEPCTRPVDGGLIALGHGYGCLLCEI